MASLGEAGSEGVKDLEVKLKLVLDILSDEADAQLRTYFTGVESSDAQLEALVVAHCFGVMMIHRLVEIVLGMLAAPSRFSQLDGKVEGLSLLLLSVVEIKRCAQSGRCRMWSTSELLDSEGGNGSLSRMRFFRLRELCFSVDLARVAFVIIMLEAKIHLEESWGSSSHSRSYIEEEFCNRPAHELFEWCKRRHRPVLKQRTLDLGQEITQHIASNEPALPLTAAFNKLDIWTVDSASEWEESSAQPRNSLPLEIDFEDIHDQRYLGLVSHGTVLKCSWHGRVAAMKIIRLDPEEPELDRRFELEVSILASLQHPNVVPVIGFGYTKKRTEGFIVMEYMPTNLENVIRERRRQRGEGRVFPLDVALDIMSQIVEGMSALRLRRVNHRDLKPANILVKWRDESMGAREGFYDVKLADFGCANVRDDLDSVFRTLRMGTAAYMAPEVMSPTLLPERKGEHGYSWKADVYSFGMVCAEILSGERPFQNLGRMDKILAAVSGGNMPELSLDSGDPLRKLIEDCWKFNAEERPDFEEVRRRLWECRVYHFFTATALSRLTQLDGKLEELWLLSPSVAEIKRCAQSRRYRVSSTSELLDSEGGNGSLSTMKFFRLRESCFSVDLARVAFVIIMLEAKIHLEESWGSSSHSRSYIEEEFCNRPAHELFEWCKRRHRPVLKQRTLDLGQEITQHIASNEPALPLTAVFNKLDIWAANPASEWEELSDEPGLSRPSAIDLSHVHDQGYLGLGASGTVLQCSWHGRVAAMKIIQLDPEESELERRFELEVSILASLQHPNVVPVIGFGYRKKRTEGCLVMEHMQTNLRNVIRERRQRSGEGRVFPLDVALDIMSQIVEGMCALRRGKVIHRDLKPDNILVNQRDASMGPLEGFYDVKLADFGSANVQDDLDSVLRTLRAGTPVYMAPEVMSPTLLPERSSEQGYTWKVDVYSFGLVCAEILSGKRPFQNLGKMDKILAAVSGGNMPELSLDSGDPLRKLIEDCWKFKAEERPDFGEVRRRLWECRVYHFFMAKEMSTRWQIFGTRLGSRGFGISEDSTRRDVEEEQPAGEKKYFRRFLTISSMVAIAGVAVFRLLAARR